MELELGGGAVLQQGSRSDYTHHNKVCSQIPCSTITCCPLSCQLKIRLVDLVRD